MNSYLNDAKSLLIGILSSSGVVFFTSDNNQLINNTIMIVSGIILLVVTHKEHKRSLNFEKQITRAIENNNQESQGDGK